MPIGKCRTAIETPPSRQDRHDLEAGRGPAGELTFHKKTPELCGSNRRAI
jgi:hypothetical protein